MHLSRYPVKNRAGIIATLTIALLAFLCLGQPVTAQLHGSYTIDGAVATGGTNYQTFSDAAADLVLQGLSGDVTFSVSPGLYTESFTIPALTYTGTSTYWSVLFDGGAGNAASCVISYDIPVNNEAVITLDGADHVTFRNLTIRSTNATHGIGVLFTNAADYNTILDCAIELPASGSSTYCSGILASSKTVYSGTGNHGSYNRVENNTITGGFYGVRWNGYGSGDFAISRGNLFIRNTITDFYYSGLFLYFGAAVTARGNRLIERPVASPGSYAVYAWYLNDGSEISGNYGRAHTSFYAFRLNNAYDAGNPGNRARVFNNMMISEGSGTIYGFNLEYPTNTDILYNSCVARSTTGTVYGFRSYRAATAGAGTELRFLNNIFSCSTSGAIYALHETPSGANAYSACDYNLFHMDGSGTLHRYQWDGLTYVTLPDMQTAVPGFHQHTAEADPMWASSTDLHSASPAVTAAGTPVAGITDDYDGDNRGGVPCIGADEFGTCTITCPANIVADNTTGACGTVVSFAPVTSAGCGLVSSTPPSGSFFPVGSTPVVCSTEAGPQCTFMVTVIDTEAPVIAAPNVRATTDPGRCDAVVNFTPTATDNCSGVGAVTCTPPSGSIFPKGTTTVFCTVTDAHGNVASTSFDVTVTDAEAPIISLNAPTSIWPPNRKYVTVTVAQMIAAVTDNCDLLSAADVRIVMATSDEPETGGGSGNTLDDMVIAQDCQSIDLRSERDATENGRVYSVTLHVADLSGNAATAVYKVFIPANNSGACVEDPPVYSVASQCGVAKARGTRSIPEGLTLEQNYPNPFNPSTTIVYSVPADARATVRIFDSYGRLVETLADDVVTGGRHSLIFDARDLPSGTYFCRLQADGHVLQRTMTLIK